MSLQPPTTPTPPPGPQGKPDKKLLATQHEELPPDADLEDRFNDFWKRHGVTIFLGIAIVAVVVVGYQTVHYLGERREAQIQAAFGAALDDPTALLSFAQDHDGRSLGGMAYLILANRDYERGEFRQAVDHYAMAAQSLAGTPVAVRASLGEGMALLKLENYDAAEEKLRELSGDLAAREIIRAEAAYHLAVSYWQRGDMTALARALDRVEDMENSGFWGFRAMQLRDRIPELRDLSNS